MFQIPLKTVLVLTCLPALGCSRTHEEACITWIDEAAECPTVEQASDTLVGTSPDCASGEVLEVLSFAGRENALQVTGSVDSGDHAQYDRCCYETVMKSGQASCND